MPGNALNVAAPAPCSRRRRDSKVFVVMSVPLFTAGPAIVRADLMGTVRQLGSTGPGLRRRLPLCNGHGRAAKVGEALQFGGAALAACAAPMAAAQALSPGSRRAKHTGAGGIGLPAQCPPR